MRHRVFGRPPDPACRCPPLLFIDRLIVHGSRILPSPAKESFFFFFLFFRVFGFVFGGFSGFFCGFFRVLGFDFSGFSGFSGFLDCFCVVFSGFWIDFWWFIGGFFAGFRVFGLDFGDFSGFWISFWWFFGFFFVFS